MGSGPLPDLAENGTRWASERGGLMSTMVGSPQPVPLELLRALVQRHFGIEAAARALSGERDQNVLLVSADDASYVLKVAHPAESPVESDLVRAALLHVERADPTLCCPRVVRTLRGDSGMAFRDVNGRERTACLITYLPGQTLASTPRSAGQRTACGRIAARIARALADFDHPGAHRALIWDARQLHHVPTLLEAVGDFPEPALARRLLVTIRDRLEPAWPSLRVQALHNDLNPLNVLVDPADPEHIVGVIDFGDTVCTALVADAAVVAAEQIPEECTALSEAAGCIGDVLRGYEAALPLTARERGLLAGLVAARLITSLIVQQWHRRRNPTGIHYSELDPQFIRLRLELARELLARDAAR